MPVQGLEGSVSANIHTWSIDRQRAEVTENAHSWLNVVRPYLKNNETKNPSVHFPIASKVLNQFINDGVIKEIGEEVYFLYRQIDEKTGNIYTGIVCTVPVEDYFSGKIKIHENTLTEKQAQLTEHIHYTGVIGEPVLLTNRAGDEFLHGLDVIFEYAAPDRTFHDGEGYIHQIRIIREPDTIQSLTKLLQNSGELYIADGHHRSAASAGYFKQNGISEGKYLAYIVPSESLKIESFYRTYKCDSIFDSGDFLGNLKENFEVNELTDIRKPLNNRNFILVLADKVFELNYLKSCDGMNSTDRLDVSILEREIFNKILKIQDTKIDPCLDFLNGGIDIQQIMDRCKSGEFDFVLSVYPCTMEEVFDVADDNLIMPPKSTFIEPKLRTGLFIQKVR